MKQLSLLEKIERLKRKSVNFPIPKVEDAMDYAASNAQRRLWHLSQNAFADKAYHLTAMIEIEGDLNIRCLETALAEVVNRHESLRTTFCWKEGGIRQLVCRAIRVDVKILRRRAKLSRQQSEKILRKDLDANFDLSKWPLFSIVILESIKGSWCVGLSIHHIICDGLSLDILAKEVCQLYDRYLCGSVDKLPTLNIQYRDFSAWQLNRIRSGALSRQVDYWKRKLSGDLGILSIPEDYPRPSSKSYRGARANITFGANALRGLLEIARKEDSTLFMVLVAITKIFLFRYCGQKDIIIGTPASGRYNSELLTQIGCFVNTVVLRESFGGAETFAEVLKKVRNTVLEAIENQEVPFDELISVLNIPRDPSRNPLFDIMILLEEPTNRVVLKKTAATIIELPSRSSKFDLTLCFRKIGSKLECVAEYDSQIFSKSRIVSILGNIETLIAAIIVDPYNEIERYNILSPNERATLLKCFTETSVRLSKEKCVHRIFEIKARQFPHMKALLVGERFLTYGQLNVRANNLALRLQNEGVSAGTVVGLMAARSIELVIGILGILKAGGAFVPLDPKLPLERLAYLVKDCDTRTIVFTDTVNISVIPSVQWISVNSPVELSDGLFTSFSSQSGRELAYIIYTSGSTGQPKGVAVEHRSLANYAVWAATTYLDAGINGFALCTAIAFDLTLTSIFVPLISGRQIVIFPEDGSGTEFASAVTHPDVQIVKLTPSHLRVLLQLRGKRWLASRFIIGGEELPSLLAQRISRRNKSATIYNEYGPTETTVGCTMAVFQASGREPTVSIGKPIANVRVYILRNGLELVPIGVMGELCVSGECLSRGYFNRPDLSNDKFVDNPFEKSKKMYRTGDFAQWTFDGSLRFLGRLDSQVKIRGYRIELGEVEAALAAVEGVRACAAIVRGSGENACIWAYYEGQCSERTAKDLIRTKLPRYMQPSDIIRLKKLPLTRNGKIDRTKFPTEPSKKQLGVMPSTPVEVLVSQIWSETLGVKSIYIDSDFFQLGGHSLKAPLIVERVCNEFNIECTVGDLYRNPTIKTFVALVLLRTVSPAKTTPKVQHHNRVIEGPRRLLPGQIITWRRMVRFESYDRSNLLLAVLPKHRIEENMLSQAIEILCKVHSLLTSVLVLDNDEVCMRPNQVFPTVEFVRDTSEYDEKLALGEALKFRTYRFRFEQESLLKVRVVEYLNGDQLFLVLTHHLIIDGHAQQTLMKDFLAAYEYVQNGGELEIRAKDFFECSQRIYKTVIHDPRRAQQRFWAEKLPRLVPIEWPFESSDRLSGFDADEYGFFIPGRVWHYVQEKHVQLSVSSFVYVMSAFNLALHERCTSDRFTAVFQASGRSTSKSQTTLGCFVNLLLIESNIVDVERTIDYIKRINSEVTVALENQEYSCDVAIEEAGLSLGQLGRVCYLYQSFDKIVPSGLLCDAHPLQMPKKVSTFFDLAVEFIPSDQHLYVRIRSRSGRIPRGFSRELQDLFLQKLKLFE